MKKFILLLTLLFIGAWAELNFYNFARIYGKEIDINENVHGFIDVQGKLWVTGTKWHMKKIAYGGTSPAILPNGQIIPPPPVKYSKMPTYPYTYFWLFDKEGIKINEGILADSVDRGTLIPIENGNALFLYAKGNADENKGSINASLIDKHGTIQDKQIISQNNIFFKSYSTLQPDKYCIVLEKGLGLRSSYKFIAIVDDMIKVQNGIFPPPPGITPESRTFKILWFIEPNIFIGWSDVRDTRDYDEGSNKKGYWQNHILIENKIQIAKYNAEFGVWDSQKYDITNASFCKFENFELYPLRTTPLAQTYPEVQSVKTKNGNILVTIFLTENNNPIAYQILFDSLGKHITPKKIEILKPEDVNDIPDGSKMYIKREPASRDKSGKFKSANVYIWGYDREDGMLYWKKYHVD